MVRYFLLGGAVSLSSVAVAFAAELATCDVVYDGSPILAGDCLVARSADELTLSSIQLKGGGTNAVPETQVKFWLDASGISYAGFYTGDMSRFADVFMSDGSNQKAIVDGCFEHNKLRACFSSEPDTSSVAEEVFRSADVSQRVRLQQFMAEYGYYQGEIDGLWGPKMASGLAFMFDVSSVAHGLGGSWELVDGTSYGAVATLLQTVAAGTPPAILSVYSFCDNVDGNLMDARAVLDPSAYEQVSERYSRVAQAGCGLFFVEGD